MPLKLVMNIMLLMFNRIMVLKKVTKIFSQINTPECWRERSVRTYFLGSERSTDNLLVLANCSTAGEPRLLSNIDGAQSASLCDCHAEPEIPVIKAL